jgi:hypothetical protein
MDAVPGPSESRSEPELGASVGGRGVAIAVKSTEGKVILARSTSPDELGTRR